MYLLTNRVISLNEARLKKFEPIMKIAISNKTFEDKVIQIEKWFSKYINIKKNKTSSGELATRLIINKKGAININDVLQIANISERSLERYFKNYIGLSPKFYSRVIRFSNIFNLVQKNSFNWLDVAYIAGFYDQAHFIKNFKEFTGEEPSKYGFEDINMANFFLKN
jgi:AraC-like DNA-binding protein